MKIDLNLFVVFDTINCEGNITKAALSLHLSQPAVRHSLGKLRKHFTLSLHGSLEALYLPLLMARLNKEPPYTKLKSLKRVHCNKLEIKRVSMALRLLL